MSEYQLQPVTFHNDTLFIIDQDGEPFVPVRPICENMGLDWSSQRAKLKAMEKRLTVAMITTVAADGKQREMVCIHLRKFFAWVNTISPDKVAPHVKETIELYQKECDEVLWNYWTKGVGVTDGVLADNVLVSSARYIDLLEQNNRLLTKQLEYEQNTIPRRVNFTPDEDAQVIKLRKQGLSYQEIGVAIGRKKGSVMSCLNRLRKAGIYSEAN